MNYVTYDQIVKIMPYAKARAAQWVEPLNYAMQEFGITTPRRQAAFLAQIGHESGQLRYVREIASGSAYEGRRDIGNTMPGDGVRYRGRGLLQITGKYNYADVMMALDIDCLRQPHILEEPINAARSAGWWWENRGLNALADREDFLKITKTINGGYTGLKDRQALYTAAKKVLYV